MSRKSVLRSGLAMALTGALGLSLPAFAGGDGNAEGAVFVLTNSTDDTRGNEVVMYRRFNDGSLDFLSSHATGGLGSGPAPTSVVFGAPIPATADGTGSQNSLILTDGEGFDHYGHALKRQLFAVNPGDNTITCFVVTRQGLRSRGWVDSGGVLPVSLAYHDGTLYVLNAGNIGSIMGFQVTHDCHMTVLPNSTRSLADVFTVVAAPFPRPAPNEVLTTPAQISFTPNGRRLVVSIKGGPPQFGGGVAVYRVRRNGRLRRGAPVVTPFDTADNTAGPFGFVFDRRGNLLLNHVNSFTFASYAIDRTGALTPISGPIPINALGDDSPLAFGGFNCWVARIDDLAYVMTFGDIPATNGGLPDGPGVISALDIARDGGLALLPTTVLGSEGIVAIFPQDDRSDPAGRLFGNHGIDLAAVEGSQGRFLYAVQPRVGRIGQWAINGDGTLTDLGPIGGLDKGVDPFAGTNPGINDFLERCFNQPVESRDPECALGSAQGVVGY